MRLAALMLVAIATSGCGDDSSGAPDAFESICGFPGDEGNELGIGKFCELLSDCYETADAPLCANLGDEAAHFCTKTCDSDAGVAECGTGAECVCGEGGCGCTPTQCLD